MIGKLGISRNKRKRVLHSELSPRLKGIKTKKQLKPKNPLKLKIIHKYHQNKDRDLKIKHKRFLHRFKKKKPLHQLPRRKR